LLFFKTVYRVGTLKRWRATLAAWRRQRENMRDVGAIPGENVLVPPAR
jgi:hypothetical protein